MAPAAQLGAKKPSPAASCLRGLSLLVGKAFFKSIPHMLGIQSKKTGKAPECPCSRALEYHSIAAKTSVLPSEAAFAQPSALELAFRVPQRSRLVIPLQRVFRVWLNGSKIRLLAGGNPFLQLLSAPNHSGSISLLCGAFHGQQGGFILISLKLLQRQIVEGGGILADLCLAI